MPGGLPIGMEICNSTTISLPSGSCGIAVTPNATKGTKGSYTQLIAATPCDTNYLNLQCGNASSINNLGPCAVDIAVGPSGSEQVIISNFLTEGQYETMTIGVCFPINIPAGTRIAARCAADNTSDPAISVAMGLWDGGLTSMEGVAGAESVGLTLTGGSNFVYTSPGVSGTNSKGSYAQLTAATPRDYVGFFVIVGMQVGATGADHTLIDIATGASGSEKIIVPDLWTLGHAGSPSWMSCPVFGPFWVPIAAGTRMACRCADALGLTSLRMALLAMYM